MRNALAALGCLALLACSASSSDTDAGSGVPDPVTLATCDSTLSQALTNTAQSLHCVWPDGGPVGALTIDCTKMNGCATATQFDGDDVTACATNIDGSTCASVLNVQCPMTCQ